MVRHNSIIGVDTQITLNRRSRVGGLVRVKKKAEKIKLIIFSGDIHFPGKTNKAFRLIPPGGGKQNSKEYKKLKNWLYIQRMKLSRYEKNYFVLVQPVVPYKKTDGINLGRLFPPDLLQESDNLQLRVVNYILYYDPILEIWDTNIQLVRTCLVLNWDQDKKIEKACASFVEIRTNGLIRDFLRIDLAKSPISYTGKRNDLSGSGLISENGSDRANVNPFSSIYSYSNPKPRLFIPLHLPLLLFPSSPFQQVLTLLRIGLRGTLNMNGIGLSPFYRDLFHNLYPFRPSFLQE